MNQLINYLSSNYDLAIFVTLAAIVVGIFFKMPFSRIMQYCGLFYCAATTLILTFSDGATEIPVAQIMAQYKYGFIALVGLTIGIKAYCVASGFHHFDLSTKFFFNFAVIPYSILLSVVGQNVIYVDGDIKKDNVQQQIVALHDEKTTLMNSLNGFPSCAAQSWCDSQAKEQRVASINSELSNLRKNASVSSADALYPIVNLISKITGLTVDANSLLLFVAFLRTWVATYATMVMSRLTAQCYWNLIGHKPKKLGRSGRSRANRGQIAGKRRANVGQSFFGQFFSANSGGEAKKLSDDQLLVVLAEFCQKEKIPLALVRRNVAQTAFKAHQGSGVRNERADRIVREYKRAIQEKTLAV